MKFVSSLEVDSRRQSEASQRANERTNTNERTFVSDDALSQPHSLTARSHSPTVTHSLTVELV